MQTTLELAKSLINISSITPNDNGCQSIIKKELKSMGFNITDVPSGNVSNLWAWHGNSGPFLSFCGHTDVVPPGPETDWTTPPFTADVRDNKLYGRGAADMKGAIASMLKACQQFLEKNPNHKGTIGFLVTSDEEGDAKDGTVKLVEHLEKNNIKLDYCIIGEATSNHELGDAIKIGRRGSLHGKLRVFGKQGHIAYPQLAENPIHRCLKALDKLTQTEWDQGNKHFSPTSFQIYNIEADTGASNLIPGSLGTRFNFRYSPASTAPELQQRVHKVLDDHELNYHIDWNLSSEPFLSIPGKLTATVSNVITDICGITTNPNTTGGTSDGRFIARTGCETIELGPVNSCIHQVDEHVNVADLETLAKIYENILQRILG